MHTITVDFDKSNGKIKPMHAVNNGPVYKFASDQRITNIDSYRAAGIPYARTHDASYFATYGGEHIVDVNFIFPDFDADPYNPDSYDFCLTDEYLHVIELAGTKTFFRLGSKIEHWKKKYNTLPPKDFKKWAVICEHIIRHYNYGWADGFNMGIEYWEIWNEPDLDHDDSENKRCWGGTKAQFFELYDVAATHLKSCFPELKIGGPAIACNLEWADDFLKQLVAPLDFFSWHIYTNDPKGVVERTEYVRRMLDKYGFTDTESILNEWNYVKGWEGDDWVYSLKSEKGLKGASFTAGTMCASQYTPLDMLMYYDARPCGMNGLFNTDFVNECLKGYYPFRMFNELYKLGNSVEVTCDCYEIYVCAARSDAEYAVMLTYFSDDDSVSSKQISLALNGLTQATAQIYLLDKDNDMTLVRTDSVSTENPVINLGLSLFNTYLIKLTTI